VIFGAKNQRTEYPIKCRVFAAELTKKNEEYEKAMPSISVTATKLYLSRIGNRNFLFNKRICIVGENPYYKHFYRGAEILPQSFWLVDIVQDRLGYNSEKPYVRTAKSVKLKAKKPWNNITFEGNIEAAFLYDVVICSYLFPFSYRTSKSVLPIAAYGTGFRIIGKREAKDRFPLLEKWLDKAELTWKEKRKEKRDFDIIEWIDYNGKLTRQNPRKRYRVVYNKTGQDVVSTVVDSKHYNMKLIMAEATIYFETDKAEEAYYLASILNSPIVNSMIKPMQAKGLWGERGVEKKVLELPIPVFQEKNMIHQKIAKVGMEATKKAAKLLVPTCEQIEGIPKPTQIARIRGNIRSALNNELQEINDLSIKIFEDTAEGSKGILHFFKKT
jgi:hypothetical protein